MEIYDKRILLIGHLKGVYLEKFDSLFHIDANIKADTAYYYEKKKLWELRSNVHIPAKEATNLTQICSFGMKSKRSILTNLSALNKKIKSLPVMDLNLTKQMTEYQIYNNTGIFTVEDTAPADSTKAVANSTRTDSIR